MVAENSDSGQLIYFPLLVPSLQQTLEQRLLLALPPTQLQFSSLTFYRSQLDHNCFYYRSPLALQLARGNLAHARRSPIPSSAIPWTLTLPPLLYPLGFMQPLKVFWIIILTLLP